jgi:hypothetical protein
MLRGIRPTFEAMAIVVLQMIPTRIDTLTEQQPDFGLMLSKHDSNEPSATRNVSAVITSNMGSNINKRFFGYFDVQGQTLCSNCFSTLAGAVNRGHHQYRSTPTYSNDILDEFETRITGCVTVTRWEELVIFLKRHVWQGGRLH